LLDAAALLGALGAVLVLLAGRRELLLFGFGALAVAEVLLARDGGLSLSAGVIAAGIGAVVVLGAAAAILRRARWLVLPLLLVAAPFRLPLDFGREHRFYVAIAHGGQLGRLLPLYAVLGIATIALIWDAATGRRLVEIPREMAVPAAGFLAFASLSLLWSSDPGSGRNLLEFFLLPFAVLIAVGARAPFPDRLPRVLATLAVALASLFAVVGIVEAATHRLIFYSHNLAVSNTYTSFFRVTSLFRDPSLYGRHVVLGLAMLVVCLWLRRIALVPAAALIAVLWTGLYFSYSQSSLAALFAVVLGVTIVAAERRVRWVAIATAVAVALGGAGIAASKVADTSVRKATSDRSRRVELTAKVWVHHPLAGVGLGAQPRESQKLADRFGPLQNFVSHTTPLTVAAELGIVGVLLYAALLAGGAWALETVRRRHQALGLSLAAVFLALFVHSLAYSGFFEDPITWLVLAVAAAFLARPREAPPPAASPIVEPRREAVPAR
jgi:O-antigen ligase/polysaccharide polymerase Wzy-like membrane protein